MKKIILTLILCLMVVPARAQEAAPQEKDSVVETEAMKTVMTHCIAPVFVGGDVAQVAEQAKLPEFPAEQAAPFLGDMTGRVFAVPQAMGSIVLKALDNGACQVMVRALDAKKFRFITAMMFEPDETPWTLVEKKDEDGRTVRRYDAEQDGRKIAAHISVRDEPPADDGIQALVTIAGYQDK